MSEKMVEQIRSGEGDKEEAPKDIKKPDTKGGGK